ncbi:hypothetical protein [Micavibrio aeruginosavorus]|uniref:hypothetical protein n=1 Tax=Micavibrio aeruginosavorus TaxID=349221 RepID=UPI003F4AD8CC
MRLDAGQEFYLSNFAPMTYGLMQKVDAAWDQNMDRAPDYQRLSNAFSAGGREGVQALEVHMKNPTFRIQIENLATNNPSLLADAVPAMMKNPETMPQKVAELNAKVNAPSAPKLDGGKPDQSATPSAVGTGPAAMAVAAETVGVFPMKAAAQDVSNNDSMGRLMAMPGAADFLDRVENNERLSAAVTALGTANNGSGLEQLAQRAESDPQFFVKLNTMIDQNPDAVGAVADQIAANPNNAMNILDQAMQGQSMMNQLSEGLGGFMDQIKGGNFDMSGLLGGIMNLVMGLMNAVMGSMGSSGQMLSMNAPGGSVAGQAMAATGFSGQLAVVDPKTGGIEPADPRRIPGASADADAALQQQQRQPQPGTQPGLNPMVG